MEGSEAVEGGVDAELEESLTECEAGAGQHDACHHSGRHHRQDQRQRRVSLSQRTLGFYWGISGQRIREREWERDNKASTCLTLN